jgi:hypothetical protein
MGDAVKDQIIEQVDRLDEAQRRQVLEYARKLAPVSGVPGRNLMRFAGSINAADLAAMSKAILEDCEKVDTDGW